MMKMYIWNHVDVRQKKSYMNNMNNNNNKSIYLLRWKYIHVHSYFPIIWYTRAFWFNLLQYYIMLQSIFINIKKYISIFFFFYKTLCANKTVTRVHAIKNFNHDGFDLNIVFNPLRWWWCFTFGRRAVMSRKIHSEIRLRLVVFDARNTVTRNEVYTL